MTQVELVSPGEFATYGTLLTQAHRLAGRLTSHLPVPQAASRVARLDD
ncbi:hypothetical protein [Streptomyces sp. NPDC096013]